MKPHSQEPSVVKYLTFGCASQEYAVRILAVREIIEYRNATRVPGVPVWIAGVLNLRGAVLPIVDLSAKFGIPGTGITPRTCILVMDACLDGDSTIIGLIVDSVIREIELGRLDTVEPATLVSAAAAGYIAGAGKVGERFVAVLNIDKVLAANELLDVSAAQRQSKRSG